MQSEIGFSETVQRAPCPRLWPEVCEIRSAEFKNDVYEKLAGAFDAQYLTLDIQADETDMLFSDLVLDERTLERKLLELGS